MTNNFDTGISLADTFGYCIIPKNTLLFRGHKNKSFDDCMFFGLKYFVAGIFDDEIQVWKTSIDIKVLFLVEEVDDRSWTLSALPRLYKNVFPDEHSSNFNDLAIKHWNIERRNKLIRKLFDDYGVSGWFTSLENKIELEVCLFDKQANANQLVLIETSNKENRNYYKDSLPKLKIFARQKFYDRTNTVLNRHNFHHEQNHYKRYMKWQNACMKDEAKTKEEKLIWKHQFSDLRTKMKI